MKGSGNMADFGTMLRLLRKERGLSQQELADALKISKSSVSMYERGERTPQNPETWELFADYFNVDIDYLMGRSTKTTKIINPNQPHYYLNDETKAIAQEIYENPDLRILFDASKDATPEDLRFIIEMVNRMKGNE